MFSHRRRIRRLRLHTRSPLEPVGTCPSRPGFRLVPVLRSGKNSPTSRKPPRLPYSSLTTDDDRKFVRPRDKPPPGVLPQCGSTHESQGSSWVRQGDVRPLVWIPSLTLDCSQHKGRNEEVDPTSGTALFSDLTQVHSSGVPEWVPLLPECSSCRDECQA